MNIKKTKIKKKKKNKNWVMCVVFFFKRENPFLVFFFFSSRRRHTRSLCDWSSDVCSSDLHRHRTQPRVDGRYYLRPNLVGVAVPGGGPGRVLASGGRLGDGRPPQNRAGRQRPRHGHLEPPATARPGAPLRSGLPIHLAGVRPPATRGRPGRLHGLGRRLL